MDQPETPGNSPQPANPAPPTAFYRRVLETLMEARVPHLVGGAYALAYHTHTRYSTKDFDLFLRRQHLEAAFTALDAAGYRTELTFPHFLGKVFDERPFVDLIFGSGNGVSPVDDDWFQYASDGELFGLPVKVCSAEDVAWSKAFIMERERFDGGDIAHLLLATSERLNWPRLLTRFDAHWRVLLAHLILFGFIYPGKRALIPASVLEELLGRLRDEADPGSRGNICRGGLLSRRQYLFDVSELGMTDARLKSAGGNMSQEEVDRWTAASEGE